MIYGVDVGSRRLAVADPAQSHYETLVLPSVKKVHQVEDIPLLGDWLADTVPRGALVVLELPFRGSVAGNIDTAVRLSQVAGAVIAKHRGPCVQVRPNVWKKAVIGHGGANKAAISAWVREHHPAISEACEEDEDLLDAACMGLYGQLLAGSELEIAGQVQRPLRSGRILRRPQH